MELLDLRRDIVQITNLLGMRKVPVLVTGINFRTIRLTAEMRVDLVIPCCSL